MMQRISVALAVFNEENNLGDCLRSVEDFAWEIVIVDGGSTDKTLDIAKNFGARIIKTDNPHIFHINKNKAIDAASGDWILQLDADEVVTKSLADEIKRAVAQESNINGYWIPRKNFFLGRYLTKGGQYPDYTMRFYRRGSGRLPEKDVHEQAEVVGTVSYFKNDLLHVRDKNFSEYLRRFNRYTELLASQLQDKRIKINLASFVNYMIIKPIFWFVKIFIRHKGFVDGFPGFVFAWFSALRFPVAYIKLWIDYENRHK